VGRGGVSTHLKSKAEAFITNTSCSPTPHYQHPTPPHTLLTLVTMQSSTSPLKGLNVTHPNDTLKVASPLPSDRILPCVMLLMAVTHTMYPYWPLQVPSTCWTREVGVAAAARWVSMDVWAHSPFKDGSNQPNQQPAAQAPSRRPQPRPSRGPHLLSDLGADRLPQRRPKVLRLQVYILLYLYVEEHG